VSEKKIFILEAAAAVMCLLLTGCISERLSVKVNPNDGGTVSVILLMEESVYSMLTGMGGD